MKFYKAFKNDLTGKCNFQYKIGGIASLDHDDTWTWLHFSPDIGSIIHYHFDSINGNRICEVEPLGQIEKFGRKRGHIEYTTNKLRIVRELSKDEIFNKMIEERYKFNRWCRYNPPYNILEQYKSSIRGYYICYKIMERIDLTHEEKISLLPKKYHTQIY